MALIAASPHSKKITEFAAKRLLFMGFDLGDASAVKLRCMSSLSLRICRRICHYVFFILVLFGQQK
jgi:hypothetical protein